VKELEQVNYLKTKTTEELKELQRRMAAHVGTDLEQNARRVNHLIMDELDRRNGVGKFINTGL
jgi:hypothetical protein